MTQTITLKDSSCRIIGYVEIHDNGDKTLKDASCQIKGYYQKDPDVTKDASCRIVGYGDILTSLINS